MTPNTHIQLHNQFKMLNHKDPRKGRMVHKSSSNNNRCCKGYR